MRVDANIVKAIDDYLSRERITARELARRLGVSEPGLAKWRVAGNGILSKRWPALFKLIRPYLPNDRVYIDQSGNEQYTSLFEGVGGNPYFRPQLAIPQMVPEFTSSQMKKFNSAIQTVEQYAQEVSAPRCEYRPKVPGCTGIFALKVEKSKMKAMIPDGSTAFISIDAKPKSGKPVLVVTEKGAVMIGCYMQENKSEFQITFLGAAKNITGKTDDIRAMFKLLCPVIMYEVITY